MLIKWLHDNQLKLRRDFFVGGGLSHKKGIKTLFLS